mmetsp:Transcript_144504/g.402611  ORF Transcript_144504/g.402611 Transcript_144504/m.402611 type:complete len:210 (-) Transcript_144504:33-662(-)
MLMIPPNGPSKWYTSCGLSTSRTVRATAANKKKPAGSPARGDAKASSARNTAEVSSNILSIARSPKSVSAVTSMGHSFWICCQISWSSAGPGTLALEPASNSNPARTRQNTKQQASGMRRRQSWRQPPSPARPALCTAAAPAPAGWGGLPAAAARSAHAARRRSSRAQAPKDTASSSRLAGAAGHGASSSGRAVEESPEGEAISAGRTA